MIILVQLCNGGIKGGMRDISPSPRKTLPSLAPPLEEKNGQNQPFSAKFLDFCPLRNDFASSMPPPHTKRKFWCHHCPCAMAKCRKGLIPPFKFFWSQQIENYEREAMHHGKTYKPSLVITLIRNYNDHQTNCLQNNIDYYEQQESRWCHLVIWSFDITDNNKQGCSMSRLGLSQGTCIGLFLLKISEGKSHV